MHSSSTLLITNKALFRLKFVIDESGEFLILAKDELFKSSSGCILLTTVEIGSLLLFKIFMEYFVYFFSSYEEICIGDRVKNGSAYWLEFPFLPTEAIIPE